MKGAAAQGTVVRASTTDPLVWFGLAAAILFFLASGTIAYLNVRTLRDDNQAVIHTHEALTSLGDVLSTVKDAETGQRGFLLTGNERYLNPYLAAVQEVPSRFDRVKQLTNDNPRQQERLEALKLHLDAKLGELKQTIDLRSSQGPAAALALVQSDRGKEEMDAIRAQILSMEQEETDLREKRLVEMADAYRTAIVSGVLASLLGIGLTALVGFLIYRAATARRRQDWLQAGRAGLAGAMLGDPRSEQLGDNILKFLARVSGRPGGGVFRGDGGRTAEFRTMACRRRRGARTI